MSRVVGFYKRHGRTHPVHSRRGYRIARSHSAFSPAKNEKLAEEVRGANPSEARESVRELKHDFDNAKTRDHKEELTLQERLRKSQAKVGQIVDGYIRVDARKNRAKTGWILAERAEEFGYKKGIDY
jgi:hypothetical protein